MTPKEYAFDKKIMSEFESDFASLIAIPSVAGNPEGKFPYGKKCAEVIDKAIEIAQKYGFRTENHEYHCASAIYGESDKEIGILAHLDVVPAGNGWSIDDPYKLTFRDGLYIGRGTNDDKGPSLTTLYAMRYLKEHNIKLPFAVRLIMGSDEEVGSSDLAYFRSVRKPPMFSFTPDAAYPVCIGEKGIMSIKICLGEVDSSIEDIHGGTVGNAVPGEAYAVINGQKITVKGHTAHASKPETGINAVGLLAEKLLNENLIAESDRKKFVFLLENAKDWKGGGLNIACSDEHFGYLTCAESVLSFKDGKLYQNFNIRYPMSFSYESIISKAEKVFFDNGFTIVSDNRNSIHHDGYFKSPDSPEIKALTNACEKVLGYECKPYTIGGGTYAREMPNAVAFGGQINELAGKLGAGKGGCHDVDEYYALEEIQKGIEIYVEALMNLGKIY